MKSRSVYPYLLLGAFLFCWINLPKVASDRARHFTVSSFVPVWKWAGKIFANREQESDAKERLLLELENQTLRAQIETVYEWVLSERRINEQAELLKGLTAKEKQTKDAQWRSFFQRRSAEMRDHLENQLVSFPAQVIYRDPSSWSSSLWVNVGEEDNRAFGKKVIAKNSPVVTGNSLVGVVDFVGNKQSRVRLITDSGLSPAVRAVRGASQNRELAQQLAGFLSQVEPRADLFESPEERELLLSKLKNLKMKLQLNWEDGYLAKGEIHGSSAPFWRSRKPLLKGIGFNFDYADEEGGARDLKTGRLVGTSSNGVPILKEGDLLVTSGLDGVFPPGLRVGVVSTIAPLKQGSFAYELEARPTANNLNDLQTLFIMPSLSTEE